MSPNDIELTKVDKHGLEVQWKEGFPFIELPGVIIYMERRNFYCDRGRYGFWAEAKIPEELCIDFADGFPRYFFSLQRAFDEMYDWVLFRDLLKQPIT